MPVASDVVSRSPNRRNVLKAGVGTLASLAGLGAMTVASAQGTPEAMPADGLQGMFGVTRSYVVKEDMSADELIAIVETFVPIVSANPGFISYNVIYDDSSRGFVSVGVFDNAESSEVSSEEAAQHRADNNTDAYFVDPEPAVVQGPIAISAIAAAESTPVAAASLKGMFGVTRSYVVSEDADVDALNAIVEGFVAIVADNPGFISYNVIYDTETRGYITVGIFDNAESAQASIEEAAQFVKDNNLAGFFDDPAPMIVQGAIAISASM